MLKRVLAIMLAGVLLATAAVNRPACAESERDVQLAKTRADVSKLGVGEKARVEVKLRDNSKLEGYIRDAGEDSFTITDSETGATQTIAYGDVVKVKKSGSGFSPRSWLIVGVAVAGAVVTWIIVKPALCDGGAQTRDPC